MDDVRRGDLPLPGALLAERYRIVSPLGQGGMGEVFRVYDLKLDQEVALKHLSPRLAGDTAALARFHREVRLARQIAHPNVCRVFDIGESGGRPFLTMELIDGEDLASLLLRIGRLLPAKGLEIAQQLCAGLAAIHESGVLHRDLKPANIMIDGRGRARITDFGISALASEPAAPARAGTPAYMAPEQLAGGGATVRSDLYSLGLVLYEILTGRRPAGANPAPPSELCPDVDPQIDHVLLRCLDPDPEARPASARELAAMLPGLDPLAAALAAGETPSPAMVAAAATAGSLRPAVGLACLAGVILACAGIIALSPQARLLSYVPLQRSPEVLADRAEAMLPSLGVAGPPADVRFALDNNLAYINPLEASTRNSELGWRFAARRCPAVIFWYRRSPRPMVSQGPRVTLDDPVLETPGEVSVQLDPEGRLYRFERVPPGFLSAGAPRPPHWAAFFAAAGLDLKRFSPASPEGIPLTYVDTRTAWEGSWTEPPFPPLPVRVEAGSLRGTPIYFRLIEPWELAGPPAFERRLEVERVLYNGFFVVVAFLALLLAARNVRLGRADTRWALRLSGFFFSACLLITALSPPSFAAGASFWQRALGDSLRQAGMIGLCYLSLEPALRRHRPERIVSWVRLLSGRLKDPLVGRDILVGSLLGSTMALVVLLHPVLIQKAGVMTWYYLHLDRLQGTSGFLAGLLGDLRVSLLTTLSFLVFLTALRPVLRRESLALAVCWAVATAVLVLRFGGALEITLPLIGFGCALFVLSWARFGLLAGVVHYLTLLLALDYPMTGEVSVWYGWLGIFALVSILGLATCGCLVATAGQPWWRGVLLED